MRWLVAALALLALALAFQLGLLVYAAYVLVGLLLFSRYLTREWIQGLAARRECNRHEAEVGDRVAVVVRVRNRGRWPVAWVLIEDMLPRGPLAQRPPRLRVIGSRLAVGMLRKGGLKTVSYQLEFDMRGYYQVGPLVLETGDLFGLHRRWHLATEPTFILVRPKVVPLEGYTLASRRPVGEIRLTHRLYEDPTRIAGVRPYQTGDSLNRIHWRATARTGTLHSKVYEPSTIAGATIVLDFHESGYTPEHEPIRSELAVTTAASLANAVYELGQQVGLVTNGRDAADRIRLEGWDLDYRTREAARTSAGMQDKSERLRPIVVETRRGPEQFQRILDTLARVELTDGLRFVDLIGETAHRLPRDATVVAILPGLSPETAAALVGLRRRGHAVAAVLVMFDDYEFSLLAARLSADRIEAFLVQNESQLSALCRQQLVR